MRLTGAQIVGHCLVAEGVEVIFGLPGGAILPLYEELHKFPIHHVLVRRRRGTGQEFVHFGGSGRESCQVQRHAAQPRNSIRLHRGPQTEPFEAREYERIDRIADPRRRAHLGEGGRHGRERIP